MRDGRDGHRLVRRGRRRAGLRRARSASTWNAPISADLARPRDQDHDQPRQSRTRLQDLVRCPTTASASRAWSSSSASPSRPIRWRCSIPNGSTTPRERAEIDRADRGYPDEPSDFFVERSRRASARSRPRSSRSRSSCACRTSRRNEYASLLGGRDFEPAEDNPMLGFRGASRYAHPAYAEGFALECRAMKRVREEMGLTNVNLMIPFCRRVERGRSASSTLMRELGLQRGEDGLEDLRDVRDSQQRDADRRVREASSTASRSAPTISRSSRSASTATRRSSPSTSTSATKA